MLHSLDSKRIMLVDYIHQAINEQIHGVIQIIYRAEWKEGKSVASNCVDEVRYRCVVPVTVFEGSGGKWAAIVGDGLTHTMIGQVHISCLIGAVVGRRRAEKQIWFCTGR